MAEKKQIIPLNTHVDTPTVLDRLQYRETLQSVIAQAEAEKKALDAGLLELFDGWAAYWPDAAGFEFPNGARLRTQVTAPRRSISAEKLLTLGVSPDIVEQASSWSKESKPFLRVDYAKTEDPE